MRNHIRRESEHKDKESGNYSVDTGAGKLMFEQGSKLPISLPQKD